MTSVQACAVRDVAGLPGPVRRPLPVRLHPPLHQVHQLIYTVKKIFLVIYRTFATHQEENIVNSCYCTIVL